MGTTFKKSEAVLLEGSDKLKPAQGCTVSLQEQRRTAVVGAFTFLL